MGDGWGTRWGRHCRGSRGDGRGYRRRGKAVRVPLAGNDGGGRKRVGATNKDGDAGCSSVVANGTRVKGAQTATWRAAGLVAPLR
jgi:hypothetical protein